MNNFSLELVSGSQVPNMMIETVITYEEPEKYFPDRAVMYINWRSNTNIDDGETIGIINM